MKINKLMLTRLISKRYDIRVVEAKKMVEMVSDIIMEQVLLENKVCFGVMGHFDPIVIKSRNAMNPSTQNKIVLPSALRTKFRESYIMKRMMSAKR
jgi:nucleoid DNA-binding protein